MIAGFRCAVCGTSVDIATPWSWRCPRSTDVDRHHVLRIISRPGTRGDGIEAMAWFAFAGAHGMTHRACQALLAELDDAVRNIAGVGFRVTPFARSDPLSDELGFSAEGGVWLKDETGNVAGSHKARHLFSILLHLIVAERLGVAPVARRPRLAIASCGNAAIAAATLATAVAWPIDVFVPEWANDAVLRRLHELGANVVSCPRRASDPPGDPCVLRFREAVSVGSIPFAVQGPENAWCLDGGRTLGHELARPGDGVAFDAVFAQVGGGAFGTCIGDGLRDVLGNVRPRLYAVQAAGCAPLKRAWDRARELGVAHAGEHWGECMWPWETEPTSAATGILDDETYDWLGLVEHLDQTGGDVVVADESHIAEAHRLVTEVAHIDADHTGTSGLAGLLAARDRVPKSAKVAVVISGQKRS
jgi:threonine dehydratase